LRRARRRARAEAGYPGRILLDFRHTAVRNLERAGVPRAAAMAFVGHRRDLTVKGCAAACAPSTVAPAVAIGRKEPGFVGMSSQFLIPSLGKAVSTARK